jgi:N-acetylmuramoyl-L-alanine amidase
MSSCRRAATAGSALLILLFAFSAASAAARLRVERVRYSVRKDRTRVVLDCASKLSYEIKPFHNPERLAINLRGVKIHSGAAKPRKVARGVVKGIRVNRLSWGTQVVLDLRSGASWKHFRLSRTKEKPDRIVVDVWRDGASHEEAEAKRPIIVAIDAGHGGFDPGATGRYHLVEKEVALDIARRLVSTLNSLGGYKAVLTRRNDTFLSLEKRTEIAKASSADAFVSIHLNSAKRRSARGVEVFFLSPSGAAATASKILSNKKKAARELGLAKSRNEDLLYMLLDVNQQTMMLRSSLLAESILKSLRKKGLPPTRGIKQRSFAVLKTISMPSVIVEVGFLSNIYDARILRSRKGRDRLAISLADGIQAFFANYPPPRSKRNKVIVHRVKKGDTLWEISRKYGTSVASLRRVNKLGRSSNLRVGQEILILESK